MSCICNRFYEQTGASYAKLSFQTGTEEIASTEELEASVAEKVTADGDKTTEHLCPVIAETTPYRLGAVDDVRREGGSAYV